MTWEREGAPAPASSWPLWLKMSLLCAGYFLCAWTGRFLSGSGGTVVSYWLPGGLFVTALLLAPTRDWPCLMIAIVPANALFDYWHDPAPNLAVIFLFCVINMIQAGAGAWLMRRFVAPWPTIASLKEFFGLLLFCGVISSAIGATLAATMTTAFGVAQAPFAETWKIIWGGDIMAVLVLAPPLLVFCGEPVRIKRGDFSGPRIFEAALIFGGLTAFTALVLAHGGGINAAITPALLFILWAALRFDRRGATLAVFVFALWSAYLTNHQLSGLSAPGRLTGDSIFTLQIFIGVAALVGIVPAIVLGQRERTLAELRESEERFRTLTDAAFESIFVSEGGKIVDVSEQGLRLFGYDRGEMIGKAVLDLVAPESRATVQAALEAESSSFFGGALIRRDGTQFVGEARGKVVRIGDRRLRLTALRDITDRKRTEQALRESEEKFSKAFRSSPDGLSISERDTGRYIEVNDGYCNLYGYTRAEMIGHTSVELDIWESPADRSSFIESLAATGTVRDLQVRTRTRTGALKIIHLSAESVELEGKPCLVSVLHDVTDRIQAEEANQSQREVLEMIASGQPMGRTLDTLTRMIEAQSPDMLCSILLLDADGEHIRHGAAPSLPPEYLKAIDGSKIGPAAGCCGTAAYRREPVFVADIATDPLWDAYRRYALDSGLRACWSTPIFDAQRKVLGTFAVYHRQPGLPNERHRQLISMATHTAAICISRHREEVEREQAIVREQHARIEYTLQLIASQEAERKRIAAELHDSMGQNLLLIKNLAQMIERTPEAAPVFEQVATINHLARLCIDEARQISRDLHPYQLDHLGLKRALEAMVEHSAQASSIEFTSKFEAVDDLFAGDAAMNLYRVVQESMNNILKHSQARHVNIRLERDIHEVVLRIDDDGIGFTVDAVGRRKGLGLKNISERVRMIGGRLAMVSAPGQGTRIEAVFPIAAKVVAESG
jgi:PAS domain S-box-containing protein